MKLSKLKYYIMANDISQDKLAEAIGTTRNTLNYKINGKGDFTLKEIITIKNFLKLDKNMFCELFEIFFE